MISKPARINHRIFRDFVWPATLPAFARFNVIYGWNGCGKTTLSNLLRRMERREALPAFDGTAEFAVGAASYFAADFATAVGLPAVRVFNREFVEASVFSVTTPITPIFYFGADSVEKQKKIAEARGDLQKKAAENNRCKEERDELEVALDRFCIDQATRVRELLSSSGKNSYNNYDKRDFRAAAETQRKSDKPVKRLDQMQKVALRQKTMNQVQDEVATIEATAPDLPVQADEVATLLKKSVVSKVLAELSSDEAVAAWVQAGLALHTGEHESQACRFCSQLLPKDRLDALTGHFNTEYQSLMDTVAAKRRWLLQLCEAVEAWRLPVKDSFYSHLRGRAVEPLAEVAAYQEQVAKYVPALVAALDAKRAKPFLSLELGELVTSAPPDAMPIAAALTALRALVTEHNSECTDFAAVVGQARRQLEEAVVADAQADYLAKLGEHAAAVWSYTESLNVVTRLNREIAELESEISESIQPAVELTQELSSYLGQSELKFESKDKGYTITRGGVPATNLSEGEKTAIAFLYFLKSLQDKSFDLAHSVVVIDDPISSLDANSMFCAFGFMKARTKAAGQLIILTHNFGFFRQVKNWFYHLPGQKKKDAAQRPARFYLQQCSTVDGVRFATIGPLDPLLHQYESEYHYLFYRVHSETEKVAATNLADYYALPNMARRLLESFLSFRYPVEESLLDKLDRVNFPEAKKSRILRFLHTYSHDGKVADPEHDLSILAETPRILADVLDLIKADDPRHFDEMVRVLGEAAAQR
jgi:wobble nucleotide-excising tRNase